MSFGCTEGFGRKRKKRKRKSEILRNSQEMVPPSALLLFVCWPCRLLEFVEGRGVSRWVGVLMCWWQFVARCGTWTSFGTSFADSGRRTTITPASGPGCACTSNSTAPHRHLPTSGGGSSTLANLVCSITCFDIKIIR